MAVGICTHNLCHDLNKQQVLEDLNKTAKQASAGLIQERSWDAGKAAISDFRERDDIAMFIPDGGPGRDPIWWSTDVWSKYGGSGWLKTHDGKEGISPDRFFTYQGLRRVTDDSKTVCLVNTHAINGYAKEGAGAPGHQDYRDDSAKKHWNKGQDFIKGLIDSDTWKTIVVGGDFNCAWSNDDRDWYPGPKLDHLLRKPYNTGSICQITLAKDSAGDEVGHETLTNVNTDHAIRIIRVDL